MIGVWHEFRDTGISHLWVFDQSRQMKSTFAAVTARLLARRPQAAKTDEKHPAKSGINPRGMLAYPKGCSRILKGRKPLSFRNPPATAGTKKDR